MDDVADFDEEQIEMAREAIRLLPVWFTERMMTDAWFFGLLLETGHTLCIERIVEVTQGDDGTIWLDVVMMTKPPSRCGGLRKFHHSSNISHPCERSGFQGSRRLRASGHLNDTRIS